MDFVMNIPSLVKVLLAFGLILFLNQTRIQFWLSLFIGTIILGIWTRLGLTTILKVIGKEAVNYPTLALVIVITEILILSNLMKSSGQLDRIVESFQGVFRSVKAVSASLPALIGLLPMPGGALFSAPMMESAVSEADLSPERKTIINYWFRHPWEFWWPLYPGILLAAGLLEVRLEYLMAAQFPICLLHLAVGTFFLLGPVHGETLFTGDARAKRRAFLRETLPISLVILTVVITALVSLLIQSISGKPFSFPQYSSIVFGLLVSIIWVKTANRIPSRNLARSVFNRGMLPMIFLIFGIMAFRGILIESRAVQDIQLELARFHIPPLLVIAILPFLSGIVTGISFGFVGASFPVVIALVQEMGGNMLSWGILAFGFGYAGMMLSPIHLCFALTRDHFQSRWGGNYRYLIPPLFIVLAGSITMSLLAAWAAG